jgi:hypothetical protein
MQDMQDNKQNNLLILDINGLLVKKHSKFDLNPFQKKELLTKKDIIDTKTAFFEICPGTREFLLKCMQLYTLAIWTSTTYSNANLIIDKLFTVKEKNSLAFIWMRDHVRYDPNYGIDPNITDFDTVKILDDVYTNAMFQRKWKSNNTLIIDDSFQKLRFNNPKNIVVVENCNNIDLRSFNDLLNTINNKFIDINK